jgi:fibronectin type III domain protein
VDAPRVTIEGANVGAFSVIVRWHVDRPARVIVEYGVKGTDTQIWSKETTVRQASSGTTRLPTLEPGTAYVFRVLALSGTTTGVSQGSVVTQAMPTVVRGRTIPNALVVNGQRFFPRMVFGQCPYAYNTSIAAGINLFMGAGCTTVAGQLQQLGGRALSVTAIGSRATSGPGLVGWHQLDEPDLQLVPAALPIPPSSAQTGRVTFLTLSNHIYSLASPPAQGRDIYPAFIARAEMIGFDLYPLQGWCRKDAFHAVYDAQLELVQLAKGKPTFQWIEAGPMEICRNYGLDPSPAIVRAETWLAVAGGARGIGYFPDQWRTDVRGEITKIDRDLASLAPALLDDGVPAAVIAPSSVRAGIRTHNGATYVIAVNSTLSRTMARITVPGLGNRKLRLYGDGRWVTARNGVIKDYFRGVQVKIYVAPPVGLG